MKDNEKQYLVNHILQKPRWLQVGGKVSYRHNVMRIDSIETFLNVKGGFHHDLRDVYFIRGLGEPERYVEKMAEIDKRMDREMKSGRLTYVRAKPLPRLSDVEETAFYTKAFDGWRAGGKLTLKKMQFGDRFAEMLEDAYRETVQKYKTIKNGISESMIRNFGIKVLYWLDCLMDGSFQGWNERSCIKVIAENVVKEQEYLFYYCLTLLGCDVLVVENKKDAEIDEGLKQLSGTVRLGDYGTAETEAYVPSDLHIHMAPEEEEALQYEANIKITLPERRPRRTSNTNKTDSGTGQAEKTFEELARLASSIVMIAVHDKNGDVIGTGSGIMIGTDGFILTNDHVAAGGCFYSVRIEEDDQVYSTDEVIKYNSNLDLAVIRIDKKLKPLDIYEGKQRLARGQKVVAIGSPLGFFNSVSDGIISGFRKIDGVDMIQFTAPTSHGSSGGAVLNMQGEVIGISTAGVDSGQNINLAVGYESILPFVKGFRGH